MIDRKVICEEADAWFLRNKEEIEKSGESVAMNMIVDFIKKSMPDIHKILEVGSSDGHNLFFLNQKLEGVEFCGIDPSSQAIEYGNKKAEVDGVAVHLIQGFSDELPYEDESFDMLYLGFCLYQVERKYLFKSLMEADRVLKPGGFCIITDFDTPIQFRRDNVHNSLVYTYKTDYAEFLIPYGYTLVEKKMYSHRGDAFDSEIQERISTQIFYKEKTEDYYIKG